MDITDKQMIEFAKCIKKGCDERCKEGRCNGCPFFNLDGCDGCSLTENVPYSWFIPKFTPSLTDDEKVLLRNLDPNFEWIARDENGVLYIYENKPHKRNYNWVPAYNYRGFDIFNELFKWCKWEDDEPWYIPDLLKEE